VMSFGSPTPIEVAVNGPNFAETRPYATKLLKELSAVSGLRDLQIAQSLDYPTIQVDVDRKKAGTVNVSPVEVSRSLAEATSSSRFTVPNFWADPKTGVGYQVQVEVPVQRMNSVAEVRNIPVGRSGGQQVSLGSVADVSDGTVMGEYDRYNMQRMVTLGA